MKRTVASANSKFPTYGTRILNAVLQEPATGPFPMQIEAVGYIN